MQILFISILAKCGVFTHVRELALYMKKRGLQPVIGLIHNPNTARLFKLTKRDMEGMVESLQGLDYFCYESDEELVNIVENLKIDLIHAHSPIVLSAAISASRRLNIPYVMTLHGTASWSRLHGEALREAKGIIAIGPEVAMSAGPEFQNRIKIIFNGVDIAHYRPSDIRIGNEPLRILWMGRTNGPAAKGVTYLAKAIRVLRKKGITIEAKVLGHALGADIGEMEGCGWVHDPLEYLQWSHIVFGRGRALREAMACGNVGFLIGQGYGGMVKRNWFEEGKSPILSASPKHGYAELDSLKIVKDIQLLNQRRDILEAARNAARKIAEENFDIQRMVDETFFVYEEALQRHATTGHTIAGGAN